MPGVIKKKSSSSKPKSKSSSSSSKRQKVTHQQNILFPKEDKNIKFVDHDILLTDAIYGKKNPEEGKGKLFRYTVTAYNSQYKTFTVKYKNEAINPDGISFYIYQEGDDDAFLPNVQEESVVKGRKLFLDKNMEVKQEEYRKADAIKQKLAMDITHLEFERMPELDNKKGRGWRHKQTG